MAALWEILLRLQMVTAGKGMFQVAKCVLSMTVTTGYSEFQIQEIRSSTTDAIRQITTINPQTMRSHNGVSSRTMWPQPWSAVTEQKYLQRPLNHFQNEGCCGTR